MEGQDGRHVVKSMTFVFFSLPFKIEHISLQSLPKKGKHTVPLPIVIVVKAT
jgi:hypothetical protein